MPFGGKRGQGAGITASNYLFTDQELDKESGLYNYDARLYDPIVGGFISADTVVPDWFNSQSLNRYTYCDNNPLMYIDPSGHWAQDPATGGWVESDPTDYDRDYNNNFNGSYTDVDEHNRDDPGEDGWRHDGEAFGWVNHNLDPGKKAAEILTEISLSAIPIAHLLKLKNLRYLKVLKWFKKNPKKGLPDEVFSGKAPKQVTPGTQTIEHSRYNPKTGRLEKSKVHYDQYGRQKGRTDYTDHGYPNNHTSPHHHKTEYGPGYNAGKNSGPLDGPYPGDPLTIN
jgi:RHS repeat-associated protein